MYLLEDRILFDGAAAVDVAAALAALEAQQQTDQQDQDKHNQDNSSTANSTATGTDSSSSTSTDTAAGSTVTATATADAQSDSSVSDLSTLIADAVAAANHQPVHVLVVSDALLDADTMAAAAADHTVVISYDPTKTSLSDLLTQIQNSLHGEKADSIAFAVNSNDKGEIVISSADVTSLNSVSSDAEQRAFWEGLGHTLTDDGRIDLLSSHVADAEHGTDMLHAISELSDADVAASDDLTGSADGADWILETGNIDVKSVYFDGEKIDAYHDCFSVEASTIQRDHEIAFINYSVLDDDPIVAALEARGVEIVYLDADKGVSQISEYLSQYTDVDAIHIITHGNDGYFLVGSDNINNSTIASEYADSIAAWSKSLTADADIMIYGCNLAKSGDGKTLVNTIAHLTGADVAASDDATGSRGDWNLEYNVGQIETAAVAAYNYHYTLTNHLVTTLADLPLNTLGDGVVTLRSAIADCAEGDSISFKSYADYGGSNLIYLQAAADPSGYGQLEITKRISIDGKILDTGNSYYTATVYGAAGARVLYVSDTAGTSSNPVDIFWMNFYSGSADVRADMDYVGEGNGGAIYVAGALQLRDVYVVSSHADINGGGIYVASTGYLKMMNDSGEKDCYVAFNDANVSGGGIFNNGGTLQLLGTSTSEMMYVYGNQAGGSGGGIYSVGDITATYAKIGVDGVGNNNSAGGDGGGVYITGGTNLSSFSNSRVDYNTAGGNGGGIYFFQGVDLTISDSSSVSNNTAGGSGGGIYFNESRYLRNINVSINDNTATTGSGGGIYITESGNFYQERGFINDNFAFGSGGALYMTHSGYGVTGSYLSDLYLYAMDISGNTTNTGGVSGNGTVYYDGVRKTGVSGAGSTIVYMSAIDNNTVQAGGTGGSGAAIYQLAGTLSAWSSTLAFNHANVNGGSIWFSGSALDVEFATFAYNTTVQKGADIYSSAASFTVINSIIYDNTAITGAGWQNQIFLAANPTAYTFNNNIYTNYSADKLLAGNGFVATIVTSGSGNIVNNDSGGSTGAGNTAVARAAIISNLYLDTAMRDYNNYYARVLPLLVDYNQSLASDVFGWRNIAWQSGTTSYNTSIAYDSRGNTRIGYQYNETTHAYVQNSAPSIGAFEPIYTIVVTSKDGDGNTTFFDSALAGGITLKEAIYWIDSYDAITYANSTPALYNKNRYVKFDSVVFGATTANTITLTAEIVIDKCIIVGMTPWLNDQLNDGGYNNDISLAEMLAWGGYRAQDVIGRITVSGNDTCRIFYVSETRSTAGTRAVYINNLTLTNGFINISSTAHYDGRGGAIANYSNLYLNNVVVQNSEVSNIYTTVYRTTYQDNSAWGGGIYSAGTNLTLVDCTVSGNSAVGSAISTDTASFAGVGGGIFVNSGTLNIQSSLIYDNTARGITDVSSYSAAGAGIFINNSSGTIITNTTIAENTNNAEYGGAGNLHGQGSAVYIVTGDFAMYYCTVTNNHTVRSVAAGTAGIMAAVVSAVNYDLNPGIDFILTDDIIANNDYSFTGASPKTRNLYDLYVVINNSAIVPGNVSLTKNIIGWTTGIDRVVVDVNNIVGDAVYGVVANLNLDTAVHYNGGKTKSYKLLDNSVAYGAGSAIGGITIDQRGADRVYAGATTSIGSYQPVQYVVVTSLADTRTGSEVGFDFANNSGGWMKADLQLREALVLADIHTNVIFGYYTATCPWNNNPVLTLVNGELLAKIGFTLDGRTYQVTKNYSLDADAYNTVTAVLQGTVTAMILDANSKSRVFRVSDSTPTTINVTISYATLRNGKSSAQGGAIFSWENLTLDHVSVLNSTAVLEGGGIYSQTGDLTLNNVTIQGNSSTSSNGGGLYYESKRLSITNTSFLSNTAAASGGGMYIIGAQATVFSSVFGSNVAGSHGGGIFSDSSNLFVVNTTISSNRADENGGGMVFNGGGYLRLGYVTVANNISGADAASVQKNGGGLYQSAGSLNIYDSIIANNYQTSVSNANRNDIYLGTAVSFASTDIRYNVLGVVTNNSSSGAFSTTNRVYNSITGKYTDGVSGLEYTLSIATSLSDNGGPTQTLYVFADSDATLNYGSNLYYTVAGNQYSFNLLAAGTLISLDQTGMASHTRGAGTITVGAYQKNIVTYYYVGTGGGVNVLGNWNTAANGSGTTPANFDVTPDQTFVFDNVGVTNITIDVTWNPLYKNAVIVKSGVTVTVVANGSSTLNLNIEAGGNFEVQGGTLAAAVSTLIVNSGTFTVSGGTVSGGINLLAASSSLVINAAASSWTDLTFSNIHSGSTVTYSYAQTQTVRAGSYGNLILSGSTKTAAGNITVNGTLTVLSGATLNSGSYTVSAAAASIGGTVNSSGLFAVTGVTTMADGGYINGMMVSLTGGITASGTSTIRATSSFTFDNTLNISVAAAGKLTMDMYNRDIYIRSTPVLSTDFDADALNVVATGALVFTTTGDIYTFVNPLAVNVDGKLTLTGKNINLAGGALFTNSDELTLNNSGTLTMGLINAQAVTFGGDITLGAVTDIGSVGSRLTNVSIAGKVIGNGYALNIYTTGNISLMNVQSAGAVTTNSTGGTIYLGGITATSITVVNNRPLSLSGSVVVTGNAVLGSGNVVLTADAKIQAADITLTGTINSFDATVRTLQLIETGASGIAFANTVGTTNRVNLTLQSQGAITINTAQANLVVKNLGITAAGTVTLNQGVSITGNLSLSGSSITANGVVSVGGNLTTSGATTFNQNFAFSGNVTHTVSASGGDIHVVAGRTLNLNAGTMLIQSGNLYVDVGGTLDLHGNTTYLDNGNLYVGTLANTPVSYDVITQGAGSLFRWFNNSTVGFALSSNGTKYVSFTVSSTGSAWIGFNVFDNVTYNGQPGGATIRGSANTVQMTIRSSAGAAFSMAYVGSNVAGSSFDPAASSIYQYSNSWGKVSGALLSSGTYAYGNSFGIDFRGNNVLDYPTEGWTIQNDDNQQQWQGEPDVTEGQIIAPELTGSIANEPFMINVVPQRGFSLIGAGGDVLNHIEILPIGGENGVNPFGKIMSDDFNNGGFLDGFDYNFGNPYEEDDRRLFGEEAYAVHENLEDVTGRHQTFKSTYDRYLEDVLAV